jgi:histidine-containing phosphotransfer protein
MDAAGINAAIESLVAGLQAAGVLDEQFSQLLLLQDDSNPEFVVEVVQLYFDDSVGKIERMGQLLCAPAPNFAELDQIVHQFKGSSASLGASHVCALCIRLREACQAGAGPAAAALVAEIRASFASLRGQLEQYVALEAAKKALPGGGH